MINKKRLRQIMQFFLDEFPEGMASKYFNTDMYYKEIIENKEEISDWDIEGIVSECVNDFVFDNLELCGCGNPEYTIEVIRLILVAQNQDNYDIKKSMFNNICDIDTNADGNINDNYYGLIQFVLYILDNKGFLEHGSSVSSGWLTNKGKIFLELLETEKEIKLLEDN